MVLGVHSQTRGEADTSRRVMHQGHSRYSKSTTADGILAHGVRVTLLEPVLLDVGEYFKSPYTRIGHRDGSLRWNYTPSLL